MFKVTLFDNQNVGTCICIDWDLYYKDFLSFGILPAISLVKEVSRITETEIKAYYQCSASGNVHLALKFPCQLSVLDAFMVRAFFADDPQRLRLDLARYMRTNSLHEMNRCFESKIVISNGQARLSEAGKWIRLDLCIESGDQIPSQTEARKTIVQLEEQTAKEKRRKKVAV